MSDRIRRRLHLPRYARRVPSGEAVLARWRELWAAEQARRWLDSRYVVVPNVREAGK